MGEEQEICGNQGNEQEINYFFLHFILSVSASLVVMSSLSVAYYTAGTASLSLPFQSEVVLISLMVNNLIEIKP